MMGWLKRLFAKKYVPVKQYKVEAFTIVVGDSDYIQAMWEAKSIGDQRDVGGFYETATRTVYVDCNVHNTGRPNFEYLGHEVWHLPELGGMFHK